MVAKAKSHYDNDNIWQKVTLNNILLLLLFYDYGGSDTISFLKCIAFCLSKINLHHFSLFDSHFHI